MRGYDPARAARRALGREGIMTGKRVAVVAPSLDILGGQSVQAQLLARGLAADGWDVRFVPINPRFPPALRWLRRVPYARTMLNEALYLAGLLRLHRVDVVHVFSASYWSFLLAPVPAMLAGRLAGARVILNYHSGEADDHLARWGVRVHPWLRLAHAIVVPSEYLREVFARHGYGARVITNAIDVDGFAYRERVPLAPRLLCTRNFEDYYRVDVTVRALGFVRARFPDATLILAGEGSEAGALRRLAATVAPGAVRFVGRIEHAAMPALLDGADVFVTASVLDNQPLSVLEAFAAGLPVVSTPTGELARVVRDGVTGRVVPPAQPRAMADAVIELLEDPDGARALARRARAHVEGYRWSRVGEAWAEVYAA